METPPYLKRPYLHFVDAKDENEVQRQTAETADDINEKPIQQDDNHKKFFMGIANGGLDYIYAKVTGEEPKKHYRKKTKHPKHVIVVGAGMSGLVSAYELRQAGHEVTVLELQERVGGRVKTFTGPFTKGLHAEAGAMRLPGTGEADWTGPSHFMTDHYVRQFNVKTRPFQNINENCFLHLYGCENITLKEWKADNKKWSDKFWPGWEKHLTEEMKTRLNIKGIDDYYERTMECVKEELMKDHSVEGWNKWVDKWSRLSVQEFLRTDLHQDSDSPRFRPWPEAAIDAMKVSKYSPFLSLSLVEFLRDELGGWWENPMYTPVNGMEDVAWAFTKKNRGGWNPDVWLEKDIVFGVKVEKVEITQPERRRGIKVYAKNAATGERICYPGDAVIVTVPIPILRQIDVPLTMAQEHALNSVTYEASTKVLLQYRKRFWQKDFNIQGGMTRTNLPIGQIHYPDWEKSGISADDRGILVSYTWGQDALIFDSQPDDEAIASAVKQVEKIHEGSTKDFEVGAVQAWFSDPTAQGAFAFLRPAEFVSSIHNLVHANPPIFLAGEALSWSNGWIQGALESGLRAAFQFYAHNEIESLREKADDIPLPEEAEQ